LKELDGLPCKGQGDAEFSESLTSGKIILELMNGNVVISEVVALMYVLLSTVEKHVPFGELVGITECMTL